MNVFGRKWVHDFTVQNAKFILTKLLEHDRISILLTKLMLRGIIFMLKYYKGGIGMFHIGDKVVYPMHGAGIIEGIEEKEILGEKQKYYVLRFPVGDMKVMIPTANVEQVGIRQVIPTEEVQKVVDFMSGDTTKMPANWNKRYRENMEKIRSGDIYEVADVVRNLMLRDREKGLSTAERKMLNSARQILISELVLSKDADEKEIAELVDRVIEQGSV